MTELEKVITGLEYCSTPGLCTGCVYHGEHCTINMYADAIKLLKEQQETIASLQGTICKLNAALAEQPVQKHGHWVVHGGRIGKNVDNRILECTECNNYLSMSGVNGGRGNANYCPNCGAIMDEEVKQDG